MSKSQHESPGGQDGHAEIQSLRRRAERAEAELAQAHRVSEVQGNVFALLGDLLEPRRRGGRRRALMEQAVDELTPIARTRPAGRALGVAPATIYRRRKPPRARPGRPTRPPVRALSPHQRQELLEVLHSERFVDGSPAQVWAPSLDEGRYLASERTMYRLLANNGEVRERRRQLTQPTYAKPQLLATRSNELWSCFAQYFFKWYDHEHRHSALGLMTPATLHYGRSEALRSERTRVLHRAFQVNPERFVHGKPQPPPPPSCHGAFGSTRPTKTRRRTNSSSRLSQPG